MSLKEMGIAAAGWQIEILATDISFEVLWKRRAAGLYSQFEVQRGLPIQAACSNISPRPAKFGRSRPTSARWCTYRHFNLLQDFSSFGSFDIVFCRNVLIYFDQATKISVLNRIGRIMRGDGYLLLGAAETVVGLTDAFKPLPEHRGLYMPSSAPLKLAQLAAAS